MYPTRRAPCGSIMRCPTPSASEEPTERFCSRSTPNRRSMKIVVCIKQVPARDSQLRVASSGAWIQDADLSYEVNEPDAYALEEGLQLKEKHGGEVVVLCAGPARAAQTIREALAKGADRAIHIEEEDLGAFNPLGAA